MYLTKCKNVRSPFKSTPDSNCWDFCCPFSMDTIVLAPHEGCVIPSGIRAIVPKGHALIAFNKSGISTRHLLIKTAELVDSDYQGEINLCVVNCGTEVCYIQPGQPIIQFALLVVNNNPYDMVDQATFDKLASITKSERGCSGFGESTKAYLKSQNLHAK